MEALHWLVLFPVYFFGAMSLFAIFDLSVRVLRVDVEAHALAGRAIAVSLIGLVALFLLDVVSIGTFTLLPVLGLALLSFLLAGIDAILIRVLPLPSDTSGERRRTSDPQVF
ncbi:MAG: hypothetical protein ACREQY_03880 [Candidatus Binatia bacterium]